MIIKDACFKTLGFFFLFFTSCLIEVHEIRVSTPIDVIPEERTLLGHKMSNLLLYFFMALAAESEMSTVARIINFNAEKSN